MKNKLLFLTSLICIGTYASSAGALSIFDTLKNIVNPPTTTQPVTTQPVATQPVTTQPGSSPTSPATTPMTSTSSPTRSASTIYSDSAGQNFKRPPTPTSAEVMVNVPTINTSRIYQALSGSPTTVPTMAQIQSFFDTGTECNLTGTNTADVCYVMLKAKSGDVSTANVATCPKEYYQIISTGSTIKNSDSAGTLSYTNYHIVQKVTADQQSFYSNTDNGYKCDIPSELKKTFSSKKDSTAPADVAFYNDLNALGDQTYQNGPSTVYSGYSRCVLKAASWPNNYGVSPASLSVAYTQGTYGGSGGSPYYKVTYVSSKNNTCECYWDSSKCQSNSGDNRCNSPCDYYSGGWGSKGCNADFSNCYFARWKTSYDYTLTYVNCARPAGFYKTPTALTYSLPTSNNSPYASPTAVLCGKISYGNSYWKKSNASP